MIPGWGEHAGRWDRDEFGIPLRPKGEESEQDRRLREAKTLEAAHLSLSAIYRRLQEELGGAHLGINISTPFMPITSDGKAPDFSGFKDAIVKAMGAVLRKIPNDPAKDSDDTIKDIVLGFIDDAIAKVSSNGRFRFNQRQLLYALRPIVKENTGRELTTKNFTGIITDYEARNGEIPGMYREPRGSIYHPHIGETITLGTLMVEKYERPEWCYNKICYIEKEGFTEALKATEWPELHDCMPMSSKGFTTRAAKDLVDKIADHGEPVTIFCVHDADGPGTMIYQTFQEATKARGARSVEIVNLGLDPWEAVEMGLRVEEFDRKKLADGSDREIPVADYVEEHRDRNWRAWLQSHRVELNEMTTEQFIAWLTSKMEERAGGKVVPPDEVMAERTREKVEENIRERLTKKILREATGANGKSVLLSTVAGILGDYHKTAPIETFTASNVDRHPTDLAMLRGARLVTATETEEGRQWAESRIKSLTGGDRVSARFMRQDFFEYVPQFKLFIAGNHRPGLRSVDEAIRRRFHLIPFAVTIPAEERDSELTEKLKAEWPGILAWIVGGCLKWQSEGLAAPEAVTAATAEYLESEDAIAAWIEERCDRDLNAWSSASSLFASWAAWAEKAGEGLGSQRKFSQKLVERKFTKHKMNTGAGFYGLRILPTAGGESSWEIQ
jgi:P4 family phage/plasmid primase-like protien